MLEIDSYPVDEIMLFGLWEKDAALYDCIHTGAKSGVHEMLFQDLRYINLLAALVVSSN